jgi:RNA recognition motif-containing protein
MTKKSSAQIQRNIKRAEARGDVYIPPPPKPDQALAMNSNATAGDPGTVSRQKIAQALQKTLAALEKNQDIKAKDRRSEKRKAMAIATEEADMPAEELLLWLEGQITNKHKIESDKKQKGKSPDDQRRIIPYIAFVGQLSFSTTKGMLYDHIFQAMANERLRVTPETLRIRLLTDPKTKKSRGMAFVEVFDPEILYALLKLHHTMLDNRRINVERSTGGGKEGKKDKIDQFRKEQQDYMLSQVKQIIQEYISRKEVSEGELDDTAILVCTRHSPVIVQAALDTYVEKNGREMDNPSAYFTYLITKLAEEGIAPTKTSKERHSKDSESRKRPRGEPAKETPTPSIRQASEFAKHGVDMSVSEHKTDLSSIFPSSKRGRGRGR